MKALSLILAIVPCLLFAEPSTQVLAPVESSPKLIQGLEFSVVTQAVWARYRGVRSGSESVILQLRITNRTKSAILFPTFDSFMVGLKSPDGKLVGLGGGRDATAITPNLLLQPGASFSKPVEAKISYKADGKDVQLVVRDGTGSETTATLQSGEYSIFFEVFPTNYDFEEDGELTAPLWSGKGVTETVVFQVKAS